MQIEHDVIGFRTREFLLKKTIAEHARTHARTDKSHYHISKGLPI